MRPSFNDYFMAIARVVATRSTCLDKQVGCILVDQDMHVISCGYNGAPAKAAHCTDLGTCAKDMGEPCRAQHAEINALMHMTGRPVLCYCTLEPCEGCAKMLRNAGVEAVFYMTPTTKSGREAFGKHWEQLITPTDSGRKVFGEHWEHLIVPNDALEGIRRYHGKLGYPKLGNHSLVITEEQKRVHNELTLGAIKEMTEVLDAVDWKPWKRYDNRPRANYENLLEEVGDVVFFLDSILMNFGFTWSDLSKAINKKLVETNNRLTNGYHD